MIRPSTISGRRRRVAAVLLAGLTSVALVAGVTADGASAKPGHRGHTAAKTLPSKVFTFAGTNTGAIADATIGTGACGTNAIAGAARDVSFVVSGISGAATDVAVTANITHTFAGDLTLTLIAPNGTTTAPVMVKAGATTATGCGDSSNLGGDYAFNDQSAQNFWTAAAAVADTSPIPPGAYRAAGPLASTPVSLTVPFAGLADTAGTWKLRIVDTGVGDVGNIASATLQLTGKDPAPCAAATAKTAAAQAALGVAGNNAASAASALQKAKAKLKKAKKSGNKAKIKRAKKRVKRAIAIKKAADAAVVSAQAALTAAQAAQAAVC